MPDGSVNEVIRDSLIDRAIRLQHYSNAQSRKMISLLNRVDRDLADKLAAAVNRLGQDSFTASHLNNVLASVWMLNKDIFDSLRSNLAEDLQQLTVRELDYQRKMLSEAFPVAVRLSSVSARQVWAAASSRPFQGRLLKEWLKGVEADRAAKIRDTIRIGIVEGRTTDQIVRDIVGRRSQQYADGIINRSRKNVDAVVRTAISHTAATARDVFYTENSDLIKAVVWTSTLDTGTTPICQLRDGLKYDLKGKPVGHSVSYLAGPGKAHWGCRSVGVPVTKSWRELGFDIDELDEGTRSSMDGYVPAETTYKDWFSKQSAARQDEILGPSRGKLYREDKYPLDRFYNDRGRVIPLEQL